MVNFKTQIDELSDIIRHHTKLLPSCSQTKSGLYPEENIDLLDVSKLTGTTEYKPEEFTITALAGTHLAEVVKILAENNQYFPFDPPFVEQGATLGGTVAAGLSGSGRYRFGGVRDFILGAKFLDSHGNLIHAGGKVVKNAAGFDIAKLMVGSLGSLGALVELSFKVFPLPESFVTVIKTVPSLESAIDLVSKLSSAPVEIHCLDIECFSESFNVVARLGGSPDIFKPRIDRLQKFMGDLIIIESDEDSAYWSDVSEFRWLEDHRYLIKVPITPKKIPRLHRMISEPHFKLRYVSGGNLAWIGCNDQLGSLDENLTGLGLSGLVVLGQYKKAKIGFQIRSAFYDRVKIAFDPIDRWVEVQ